MTRTERTEGAERIEDGSTDLPSRAAFASELEALVDRTRAEGVDLAGAYTARTPQPDQPDYTIEISKLAKRSDRY